MNANIFIATPMYGGQCYGLYTKSLIQLIQEFETNNIGYYYSFLFNESFIPRARNYLAHQFLSSDATHLLFLDADIVFQSNDIIRMIQADKDIVGGVYPLKSIDWLKISESVRQGCPPEHLSGSISSYVFEVNNDEDATLKGDDELKPVLKTGTGYMLIKREALEKLSKHTEVYTNDPMSSMHPGEDIFNFFKSSICPETNRLFSEDYHFCSEWKKIGGEIYIASWARAYHIGMHVFG